MGAQAIELELETLEGAGGYAREMTEDRAARQRELLTPYIAAADALITTAAVPGRQAPMLVTRGDGRADEARLGGGRPGRGVRRQRRGLGRRRGGRGSATRRCGAAATCPSQMPGPARRLYAQNIVNIVTLMTADEGDAFAPDFEDEIVAGVLRHPRRRDPPRADPRGARGPARRAGHEHGEPSSG